MGQHCTVVQIAGTGCDHGVVEALQEVGDGEVEVVAFGGFESVVEVLELEFGWATGFEIAFNHAESVFGEDA